MSGLLPLMQQRRYSTYEPLTSMIQSDTGHRSVMARSGIAAPLSGITGGRTHPVVHNLCLLMAAEIREAAHRGGPATKSSALKRMSRLGCRMWLSHKCFWPCATSHVPYAYAADRTVPCAS